MGSDKCKCLAKASNRITYGYQRDVWIELFLYHTVKCDYVCIEATRSLRSCVEDLYRVAVVSGIEEIIEFFGRHNDTAHELYYDAGIDINCFD